MNFSVPANLPRPEQLLNAQRLRLQEQADKLFTAINTVLEDAIARALLACPSVSVRDYDFEVRNFARATYGALGWNISGADTWVFAPEPDVLKVAKEEPSPDPAYVPYARVHVARAPTGWTEQGTLASGASIVHTGLAVPPPEPPPAPRDRWQEILAEESARGNPTRYIVVPRDVIPVGVGMELWDSAEAARGLAQQTNQGQRLWTPDSPETLDSYSEDEGGWSWAIVDLHQVYAKELAK